MNPRLKLCKINFHYFQSISLNSGASNESLGLISYEFDLIWVKSDLKPKFFDLKNLFCI